MKEKKIKNILITQDYCVLDGLGTSINTLPVAKGLVKKGFKVSVCSPNTEQDTVVEGVKVFGIKSVSDLEAKIQEVDLVIPNTNFSVTYKPLLCNVVALCNKYKVLYVPWVRTTVRNSCFNNIAGRSDFAQEVANLITMQNLQSPLCGGIICNSTAVKKCLMEECDPQKLHVLYNSVDPSSKAFAVSGTNTKKVRDIIFIGRLSPEKGLLYFLSALKLLKETKKDVQVLIVGNGPDKDMVLSWSKLLGLKENIEMVDKIENGALLEELKKSKVCVNTSFTESFGNTVIEAMAVGVPVVVPNIEGPLEIVEGGKLGFVFNVGNTQAIVEKILEALDMSKNNKQRLEEIREKTLKKFSLANQVNGFCKIVKTACHP